MRQVADAERIRRFMRALGREATAEVRVYFTGGATAVLFGWRGSTIDVDVKIVPDDDHLLRTIPRLKDELEINVELASPADFIPVPPGWEDRSPYIAREGRITYYHFDLYAQALAKLERSHAQDVDDVQAMLARRLIDPRRAIEYFQRIEPELYRYPAVDPRTFRQAVEEAFDRR
ncbi:MAG: DUF6036 family nucleotidyltransferase [Armatimonadota bacterium]|nr:DUF6036 family nucleotidyltransferase [Armatimonadota bacterium]MDR7519090.1 DUF6036 family nucleotidyltransferase [Armatimonadota bacterium]MDR7548981.1 DUF6036 family nucleotidyltransferase [Armatimonadota bacterium]